MKALALLKLNIEALLRARHQEQKDLAQWCHRSEQWLSAALTQDKRGIPVKYLDRIADFFGIATYQLFQPGISPLTEQRKGQRRKIRDRRVSNLRLSHDEPPQFVVALDPEEIARIQRFRLLSASDRTKVDELLKEANRRPKKAGGPSIGSGASGES